MSWNRHKLFPGIVRDTGILGGEPVIAGTRIPVRSIVILHQIHSNMTDLCNAYPSVERERLQEALEFYKAHSDEIDHYIEMNEREATASDDVARDVTEERRRLRASGG